MRHVTTRLQAFVMVLLMMLSAPAQAATLIRDAEIERSLKNLMRPVLEAAGMGADRIRVLVIKDSSLNAFVADSRHIFVHSGLILKLNRPEALQAVLAHELAHITNGHLTRRSANAKAAGRTSAIGFALAVAAAAAGEAQAGIAIGAGASSSARRVFLSHTRAEEASADETALRTMARAGIDPTAMTDILELFTGQEALSPGRQDPYARSHPLTRDRLRAVKGFAAGLKGSTKPTSAESAYWYARMDAKLEGFLRNSRYVLRRPEAKGNGEAAILRRASAYTAMPNTKKALKEVDALLRLRPRDPYYHELKGQILLESRQYGAAVTSYQNANKLAPREPLILSGLGRALLAMNTKASNKAALSALSKARANDPDDPSILRNVAVAHAKNGQPGLASAATAERYAVLRKHKDALLHARRALGALPRGSSGWLRAQDVETASERALGK